MKDQVSGTGCQTLRDDSKQSRKGEEEPVEVSLKKLYCRTGIRVKVMVGHCDIGTLSNEAKSSAKIRTT